ncbi:MAG: hypothetical protein HOG89_00435 [Candidatus Peribacter sp.]|nr:hypothetical protein [Candidatus Peribacter sp.]MBT4393007.1 hypothetical protein [Candidatus Peribacter sp.]MBT4601067.1 hypothetical protein [Candidatus Peribacter sp.]MBT5149571.1 hypothetical protein [Candidatus Peribacter sp.]MBT5637445.1 hypothetical protein [Candidatus Peribacter sp.]
MIKFPIHLGAVAASIATLTAVVLIHNPAPAPADPFEGLHLSAPAVIEDEILNAPVVSYQSDTFGYKLKFPGNWELDDTREEFDGDILNDPSERMIITISETQNEDLMTKEGMDRMSQSIEESLTVDPAFKLLRFDRLIWKKRPTLFTDGVRNIGGKRYHTREYNIFRESHGGVLNVSITTQEDAEVLYDEALQNILRSLDVCPPGREKH